MVIFCVKKAEIFLPISDVLESFSPRLIEIWHSISLLPQTKIHKNRPDKGDLREDELKDCLERYIPKKFTISKGGFIFDSNGNQSNQIDLLITTDYTLQFQHGKNMNRKSFNCVEGCLCAISIKSKLTKKDLYNAMENLGSIPTTKKFQKNPAYDNLDELLKPLPLKVIFGFDGISYEKIKKYVDEYFIQNKIPSEKKPHFIIVNNKSILQMGGRGMMNAAGNPISEGKYLGYSLKHTKYVGGRSLISLLTEIQRLGNITKEANFHFGVYLNKLKLADKTWKLQKLSTEKLM